MSSTSDKAEGMANEAVGNVKQAVGKATDNDKLQAEGKVQELKGEGQQTVGKVKDAIKKGVDKA
ncbi:CsbD family protein [Pseudomonas syringae pv. syringae]|uniref:CsbD family protein n=1 Tax=Pseudomonas syringae TaxID=317 RepID=UPI002E7C1095|nr:CsbD family protein [Pseudomonas syringae]MEE1993525.1 CsbD family protein [Pseudomonas syringae pv. syringae]MEE1998725.1 CsbD family protein [Pseudomonas syringae pv. syringae]